MTMLPLRGVILSTPDDALFLGYPIMCVDVLQVVPMRLVYFNAS